MGESKKIEWMSSSGSLSVAPALSCASVAGSDGGLGCILDADESTSVIRLDEEAAGRVKDDMVGRGTELISFGALRTHVGIGHNKAVAALSRVASSGGVDTGESGG